MPRGQPRGQTKGDEQAGDGRGGQAQSDSDEDEDHSEPIVVRVAMADHEPRDRFIPGSEAVDRRQRNVGVKIGVQRPPHIENEPVAVVFELNATPADLSRAAMNPGPHRLAA